MLKIISRIRALLKPTMTLNQRIAAFLALGNHLSNISDEHFQPLARQAAAQNAWFTPNNLMQAIEGIAFMLESDQMLDWIGQYQIKEKTNPLQIGVVMAGNIPFAGFHDSLCVLVSGHNLMARLSSSDTVLPTWVLGQLMNIEPRFRDKIKLVERVNAADAIIATGSDNSARYFKYYFGNKPHIIRHNRNSAAVLTGFETNKELEGIAQDIFIYFGLGCRSVSKLYVPVGYDFIPLLDVLAAWPGLNLHSKYFNNYEYNRAIYLINLVPHYDTGSLLVTENQTLTSPVAVLHYEYYPDFNFLKTELSENSKKLQAVVCADPNQLEGKVIPGKSQWPQLWDYADGVDTLAFLEGV